MRSGGGTRASPTSRASRSARFRKALAPPEHSLQFYEAVCIPYVPETRMRRAAPRMTRAAQASMGTACRRAVRDYQSHIVPSVKRAMGNCFGE